MCMPWHTITIKRAITSTSAVLSDARAPVRRGLLKIAQKRYYAQFVYHICTAS